MRRNGTLSSKRAEQSSSEPLPQGGDSDMPYRATSQFWSASSSSARSWIAGAALAGLAGAAAALWPPPGAAQQNVAAPNLYVDSNTAWLPVGDEFLPPP